MNPEPTEPKVERSFDLERLVFFSDAVFAIAITLMAIELRPPTGLEPNTSAQLLRELLADWSHFFAFGLSFWIIAVYWVAHHRLFRYIIRCDEGLIWRNMVLLFFVALVPFTTLMMGEDGDLAAAVVIYASSITLLGLSGAWLWHHASKGQRLTRPDLEPVLIRRILYRSLATPIAGVIVILLAPFLGSVATLGFLLAFVFQRLLYRAYPIPGPP